MIALIALVFTSTADVTALAASADRVWAATRGGIVEVDPSTSRPTKVYTSVDGLPSNEVRALAFDGKLRARTERAECTLEAGRFLCTPAAPLLPPAPRVQRRFHGARETARIDVAGRKFVGTAGGGLRAGDHPVEMTGEICGNHVEALAEFRGELWVGSFDRGLCAFDGAGFRRIPAPFKMVNDLRATPRGLYVAAAEGLFLTRDGRRFRRETRVRERGANRLALAGEWLYATTPVALYALRIEGRDAVRVFRKPGGSTAVQGVAVSGREVWLASEDRGVLRLRRGRFQPIDRAAGMPSSWVVDVAPAADGGVWAATLRHGLARVDAAGSIASAPVGDRWLLRLQPDGGAVLVGTQGGAWRVTTEGAPEAIVGLPDARVHAFLRTASGLWVGTEGGLALLPTRPDEGRTGRKLVSSGQDR